MANFFTMKGVLNSISGLILGKSGNIIKTKNSNTIAVRDNTDNLNVNLEALRLVSTQITGTSPFSITSTTVNTNLNSDLLDDHHFSDIQYYHGIYERSTAVGLNPLPINITSNIFTLNTSANPITYYYQGTKVIVDSDKTATLSSGVGFYYIYFNGILGTISASTTFPGISDTSNVLIATIIWNGTLGLVNDERHSFKRNCTWHQWAHNTVGARYKSGLTMTNNGGTGTGATFSTTAGEIWDEDIIFSVPASSAFPTANTCRLLYQNAATTYAFDNTASTTPFKMGANNRPVYIDSTYNVVQMTSATNRYINFFAYASTDLHTPIYIFAETVTPAVAADNGYTSLTNARAVAFPNLSNFGLSPEMKPIYRIIVRANGVLQAISPSLDDYRTVTSLPMSAGSVSTTASAVTFAPFSDITATSVQAAIEQIDSVQFQGAVINGATTKNPPIDADTVGYVDTEDANVLKKLTWANIKAFLKTYFDTLYATTAQGTLATNAMPNTVTALGALEFSATTKATPVDADIIGYVDTEASNVIKKMTMANLKTYVGSGGGGLTSEYGLQQSLGGIGGF
jgi:hypothetical protein